jgi:hypothetical protein
MTATALAMTVGACGGSSPTTTVAMPSTSRARATVTSPAPRPAYPPYPQLLRAALSARPTEFVPAVRWKGITAAWVARTPGGMTLMSFNQRLLELRLHSGTVDAGSSGWRYGPSVRGAERSHLAAAFNGGFRLSTGAGGFEAYGRSAATLRYGAGSIVIYTDGSTDIGSWHQELPDPVKHLASVRQNLQLLIDHGTVASNVDCVSCWGATLGGVVATARSGLGITRDGRLIWAGGEGLTVSQLADALLRAKVVRAVELDINPEWVASYWYGHRGGHGRLAPVPALATQSGIPGQYLSAWSRDFFTVVSR